jgi:hypothetical protein
MDVQRAVLERQLLNFRTYLEGAINGATCSLTERGELEISLPRDFRKQDHRKRFGQPDLFDQLIERWGKPFITRQRGR